MYMQPSVVIYAPGNGFAIDIIAQDLVSNISMGFARFSAWVASDQLFIPGYTKVNRLESTYTCCKLCKAV